MMGRLSKPAFAVALLVLGAFLGSSYGTIVVYSQSRERDFLFLPAIHFASLFDLETVSAAYPGGLGIIASVSANSEHPSLSLTFDFGSARLGLMCTRGRPATTELSLVSKYHAQVKDTLLLRQGTRQLAISVNSNGLLLRAGGREAEAFLTFLSQTPFPRAIRVTTPGINSAGLYDIPTFGVQNVSATISINGYAEKPLDEYPSDPYAVMRRLCIGQ